VSTLRAIGVIVWDLVAMVAAFVVIVVAASVALVMAVGRRK
jgi:hypothetical protein